MRLAGLVAAGGAGCLNRRSNQQSELSFDRAMGACGSVCAWVPIAVPKMNGGGSGGTKRFPAVRLRRCSLPQSVPAVSLRFVELAEQRCADRFTKRTHMVAPQPSDVWPASSVCMSVYIPA